METKEPLVSVILPTYNVATYLLKCLCSIECQTYTNIEVYIIVDGATDGSAEIANDFCKSHKRFHYVWQENQGSGPARNKGMQLSKGQFLCFIDPDDWVEPNYIEQLVRFQQEKEYDYVVVSGRTYYQRNGEESFSTELNVCNVETLNSAKDVHASFNRLFQQGLFDAPHHKLFVKQIIESNGICFPALRRSQDIVFNLLYLEHVKNVKISDYVGYNYRSFIGPRSFVTIDNYITAVDAIYDIIKKIVCKWGLHETPEEICYRFAHNLVYLSYDNKTELRKLSKCKLFNILIRMGKPKSIHMRCTNFLIRNHMYAILGLYYACVNKIKFMRRKK